MSDNSAQARPNAKQLLELLAASPVVSVLGVVTPMGVTGGQLPGEDRKMYFWLEPWRTENADLQTNRLTIQRVVHGEELYKFMALILPYTVIRIRARVIMDAYDNAPQGQLEEFLGNETSDLELLERAKEAQVPITFEDAKLGKLTLEPRIGAYITKTQWMGNSTSLYISTEKTEELLSALQCAHAMWTEQAKWDRRIRKYAVKKLLPVKNASWLRPDEFWVTPCYFRSRLRLRTIAVKPDAIFEFSYDDGGLFWGHTIKITGNLKFGPINATVEG